MDEILKRINELQFPYSVVALSQIQMMIVEEYRQQARNYASAVLAEASTFNAEMEDTFKPSVTKAEFRAKESVGDSKIIAEKEMKALEMLFEVVKTMIESSWQKQVPQIASHEFSGTTGK